MESFGIKEHVITWKVMSDLIVEGLENEDEGEESIKKFKVILDDISSLNKEVFLSFLHVLSR